MSANQSVRYDFGRCTVEHVGGQLHGSTPFGSNVVVYGESTITVRLAQSPEHKNDEALFTLADYDARLLATAILETLDAT